MGRYILKRLVYMLFVFLLLTFVLFSLYQLMPANRAYTDAREEIAKYKQLSDEEKKTKFEELYLEYQADEPAGVARLSWRVSGR